MKKIITALSFIFILNIAFAQLPGKSINVYIDDWYIIKGIIMNDVTYVAIRDIAEYYGFAHVYYDKDKNIVKYDPRGPRISTKTYSDTNDMPEKDSKMETTLEDEDEQAKFDRVIAGKYANEKQLLEDYNILVIKKSYNVIYFMPHNALGEQKIYGIELPTLFRKYVPYKSYGIRMMSVYNSVIPETVFYNLDDLKEVGVIPQE